MVFANESVTDVNWRNGSEMLSMGTNALALEFGENEIVLPLLNMYLGKIHGAYKNTNKWVQNVYM